MGKFHDVLGVSPDADMPSIKKAYLKLFKENHPDLHPGDKEKEARAKEISAAWTGLQKGDDGDDRDAKAKAYAKKHFKDSGFDDVLKGILRDGFVAQQFGNVGKKGQNVGITYSVPLMLMVKGGTTTILTNIPQFTKNGIAYKHVRFDVELSPNTPVGFQKIFEGEGTSGADGSTGDLIITFHPESEGIYECEGLNLIVRGKVPSVDGITGKRKKFQLPNGEIQEFDVPVGCQNNSILRIPGKGLTSISGNTGNLIIVFELITPEFSEDQRKQIKNLLDSFS